MYSSPPSSTSFAPTYSGRLRLSNRGFSMLKRIPTSQVRLGMFIQSLEGSWLSHPFWKTRFVLETLGISEPC